jgi:hypothetical protein
MKEFSSQCATWQIIILLLIKFSYPIKVIHSKFISKKKEREREGIINRLMVVVERGRKRRNDKLCVRSRARVHERASA